MAGDADPRVAGEPLQVAVTELLLDPENPRLPPEVRGSPQRELALYIDEHYDPLRVARSIAAHGYFSSEPLIVIQTRRDESEYVVVEGNRRLVALLGLADPELRASFQDPKDWDALAEVARLPGRYPAVLAEGRRQVAPIIGYRHISGIEPWDPLAKSRFVAALVDDPEGAATFAEAAAIVGESPGDVRALYRNERIIRQARDDFAIDTTSAENEFGVFTRAMNSQALRSFIGAPAPAEVAVGRPPLSPDKRPHLEELTTWIFGDRDAEGKVISESRDLTTLGRVVVSDAGLEVLRETGNLEDADQAAGGPLARLLSRLTSGRNAMRAALGDIDRFGEEPEVIETVEECWDLATELRGRL